MSNNKIENVAVVGVTGNVGKHITRALLETGKHKVTSVGRGGKTSELPQGVEERVIDYDNHSSIVEALRGQDALVVTLGVMAPKDTEIKLARAAAEAGVQWILPNEYSPDTSDRKLCEESIFGLDKFKSREEIIKLGNISYIALSTGFWYEWSLGISEAWGFDINNKKATLIDGGDVRQNSSTWPHVGDAVAALLSLPIKSSDGAPSLESYKNQHVYTSSFNVSQNDMFESLLRVTNSKREDWTIKHQTHQDHYNGGLQKLKGGDRTGFIEAMYGRFFFPDGAGIVENKPNYLNSVIDFQKEDMDKATAVSVERAKGNVFGYSS